MPSRQCGRDSFGRELPTVSSFCAERPLELSEAPLHGAIHRANRFLAKTLLSFSFEFCIRRQERGSWRVVLAIDGTWVSPVQPSAVGAECDEIGDRLIHHRSESSIRRKAPSLTLPARFSARPP